MSRFHIFLVNVLVIAMTISVAITSERVNRGFNQIERPIIIRVSDLVSTRNRKVVPLTDLSSIFCLKLNKYKVQYQKLDRIVPTTAAPTTAPACICVPFYLCDSNQTIITDGSGVIDVRIARNTTRTCPGLFDVCCYPRNVTVTPTRPTYPTLPTFTFPTIPTTRPTTAPPTTAPPTTAPLPNCICVEISQCDPNGIVTISGEGVINPRYGLCPGTLVCCRILATQTPTTIPTTIPTIPTTIPTSPPTTAPTTTASPTTVTTALPGQVQLCFVCGIITLCLSCTLISIPGGGSVIDPRFSDILSEGDVCTARNIPSCQSMSSRGTTTDLDPPKNPGTSQECYCVKTWLCSEGNVIYPDGLGIIDSRFTLCSSADQVCCRLEGINVDISVSSRDLVPNEPNKYLSQDTTCGIQNNNYAPPQPFPPGSEKTYFAEFPWMVALLKSTTAGYVFQCGASLISNEAILTAAHCVVNQKPENLIARFGLWKLGNTTQPLPIQEAKILAIVVHPSYYSSGLFHDVAFLVLAKPVTYSANVLPICLPEQGAVFSAGTRCYGIGWGSDAFGPEGHYQTELRKLNLPIVGREDCQTRLRNTKLGQYFQLHGTFICAGGEANTDTCRGDGGGPLICQVKGQFVQAGIVSWGIGCKTSNVPAVYASVSQHRQWINQQFATYGV
ncbi:phenoloxidase-activating factor 2 [Solenopsis invicta]|uniref:phenoloxidase-activating factor 2 n=1 Tax=Solenopsis invicta TaxID=13686 RepID=UPI00193E0AE7|nr:phenoloxidase-activating factor 2 [Solenopsis invicta]